MNLHGFVSILACVFVGGVLGVPMQFYGDIEGDIDTSSPDYLDVCLQKQGRCGGGGPICDPCAPPIIITINGVNDDYGAEFHSWVNFNTPGIPDYQDPYDGALQACFANPVDAADAIEQRINDFRADNPCQKVIVIGHSLGAIAAWSINNSNCNVYLDPPTEHCEKPNCPATQVGCALCSALDSICLAKLEGIDQSPFTGGNDPDAPWGDHNPWDNPYSFCGELSDAKSKIDMCLDQIRAENPECTTFEPRPLFPPGCIPTPTFEPTPTPSATPTPTPCRRVTDLDFGGYDKSSASNCDIH